MVSVTRLGQSAPTAQDVGLNAIIFRAMCQQHPKVRPVVVCPRPKAAPMRIWDTCSILELLRYVQYASILLMLSLSLY